MKTPDDLASEILRGLRIRGYSLVGGERVHQIVAAAIEKDRADYPRVIKPRRHVEGDWDLAFDEDSGDEAWWIELQLLDPDTAEHFVREIVGTLTLSDVEAIGLAESIIRIVSEGRKRYA